MNRNLNLKSGSYLLIKSKLSAFAFLIAVCLSGSAFDCGGTDGASANPPRNTQEDKSPSGAYQREALPSVTNRTEEFPSGTYQMEVTNSGKKDISKWDLIVSGNQITGSSGWNCCPSTRVDPLRGTIEGNNITIERDCRGQGISGECRQVYTGTIRNGAINGSFSGTGAAPNNFWTLNYVGAVSKPPPGSDDNENDESDDEITPLKTPTPVDKGGGGSTASGDYRNWIGTWRGDGDRMRFQFSGDSSSPSVWFQYDYPDAYWNHATGSGPLRNCKFDGNQADCEWLDNMTTASHNSKANGKIKLTLNTGDDTIRFSASLAPGGIVSWKGGKPMWALEPIHYSMFMRAPGNDSHRLKRQK